MSPVGSAAVARSTRGPQCYLVLPVGDPAVTRSARGPPCYTVLPLGGHAVTFSTHGPPCYLVLPVGGPAVARSTRGQKMTMMYVACQYCCMYVQDTLAVVLVAGPRAIDVTRPTRPMHRLQDDVRVT